jgi:hypothetical protein
MLAMRANLKGHRSYIKNNKYIIFKKYYSKNKTSYERFYKLSF